MPTEPDSITDLDDALYGLGRHSSVEERLAVLRQLVEFWGGPLHPDDGYSDEEAQQMQLPMPLRTWFRMAGQGTLDRIAAEISPLALLPWRWPAFPGLFYARNGGFMFASPNDDDHGNKAFSIWVGAQTPPPVAFLKGIVDDEWDYAEF